MEKKFLLNRIKQVNPKAAEEFEKNPEELERLLAAETKKRELMKNPNSLEAQKAIEEAIRQQNILHNMEAALESNLESFGHIDMLYLSFQVDGHVIDAFVDTGAQMTISNNRMDRGWFVKELQLELEQEKFVDEFIQSQ
jgi:predicted aspartyl protease